MDDKKAQEHTFLENGKVYYNMISEERIREIIQEEIAELEASKLAGRDCCHKNHKLILQKSRFQSKF